MKTVALVLAFLFVLAVPLLAQESITLTTYYPAPSGDYSTLNTETMNIRGHLRVQANVGLGFRPDEQAPTERLVVNGNIMVTGTDVTQTGGIYSLKYFYVSDQRLKENIITLSDGLEKVLALRGVSFNFRNSPGIKNVGLIAQEVEAVVPEVVATGSDGMKSVEYGNLVALLIEAVKAQQVEITLLKSRVAALEALGR